MNGKHAKEQYKKRKIKIRISKERIKMIIAMSILIISTICVLAYDNGKNENNQVETSQIQQVENIENTTENIDKNNEMGDNSNNKNVVTSRGNLTRNIPQGIITEKLENPEVKYVSNNSGLNVRENYDTQSKIVKTLAYAEQVTITEKYQDWGKIGDSQWVNTKYLSDTKPVVEKETTKKVESKKQAAPSTTASNGYTAFTATGYCSCKKCCGKTTGMTASGAKATAGTTVAMSSKYAFGTKIEIKGMGTYICQDRGGAIQGNKIDIYFGSHQAALNFGRRTVYVKILQ